MRRTGPGRAGEGAGDSAFHEDAGELKCTDQGEGGGHTSVHSPAEQGAARCAWGGTGTYQLDVADGPLLELLQCPLGCRLQWEGEALQGLVLALHTDLCLHLGVGEEQGVALLQYRPAARPHGTWRASGRDFRPPVLAQLPR